MSEELFFQRSYSAQIDPWTSLTSLYTPVFQKDFCHQNDLTLEVTSMSFNHSKIRIKQTLNFNNKVFNLFDEMRICLPVRSDSTLYGKIQNSNMRIQYDHGIRVWKGFVYNLYSSFNASKNETFSPNLQLGTILLSRSYNIDNLFKLSKTYVKWYHKTMLKMKELRFGLVTVMNFYNSEFLKKDLFLGYQKDKIEVHAHAIQGWNQLKYQSEYFSSYKLMLLYKQDQKRSLGIQAVLGKDLKTIELVEGLIEYKHNQNNKIKIKMTNKFNMTLLLKKQWSEYLSTSFGGYLAMSSKNKEDKSRVGFKIEVNI